MAQDSKIINFSLYLLFIALIFLVANYLIRPLIAEVKKFRAELLAYKEVLERKNQTLEEFNKVAVPYKAKQEQILKLNEMVPQDTDMIYTLIQFENVISGAGMTMKGISFGTLEGMPLTKESGIGIFPVNITVEGTYDSFKNLLDSLAQNLFLMDVATISFAPSQDSGMYSFNLRVDTYTEKSPSQPKTESSQAPEGTNTSEKTSSNSTK